MRVYVDTADIDRITDVVQLGIVDGVTTNPSLVAETNKSYRTVVETIADVIDGPIFTQVIAGDADEMVREARGYQRWDADVIAKIPATRDGFVALARLRHNGVPAGSTVVFSIEQAILAAKNDASFVAPYVGRLDDAGADGLDTVRRIQGIYDTYGFDTEVLAASIRNTTQAMSLYEAGIDAVTMSPDVLEAHVSHPETAAGVAGFDAAWAERGSPLEQ